MPVFTIYNPHSKLHASYALILLRRPNGNVSTIFNALFPLYIYCVRCGFALINLQLQYIWTIRFVTKRKWIFVAEGGNTHGLVAMRAVLDSSMLKKLYDTININIMYMYYYMYSSIVCQMIYYVNFFWFTRKTVHTTLVRLQHDLLLLIDRKRTVNYYCFVCRYTHCAMALYGAWWWITSCRVAIWQPAPIEIES